MYSGQVYVTENGGGSWTPTDGSFGETWWTDLVIDPHEPQHIYASGWHGAEFFARSLDGGTEWHTMTTGTRKPFVNDVEFHPTVSGTVFALSPWEIFSSTDAGTTWHRYYEDTPGGWTHLLDPQTGKPRYIGHIGKALLRSDNGGKDWKVRNHGLAGISPQGIASSPADPRYVYVVAEAAGGFVSNDGGEGWQRAEFGGEGALGVAVDPHTPTVAYMGEGSKCSRRPTEARPGRVIRCPVSLMTRRHGLTRSSLIPGTGT